MLVGRSKSLLQINDRALIITLQNSSNCGSSDGQPSPSNKGSNLFTTMALFVVDIGIELSNQIWVYVLRECENRCPTQQLKSLRNLVDGINVRSYVHLVYKLHVLTLLEPILIIPRSELFNIIVRRRWSPRCASSRSPLLRHQRWCPLNFLCTRRFTNNSSCSSYHGV